MSAARTRTMTASSGTTTEAGSQTIAAKSELELIHESVDWANVKKQIKQAMDAPSVCAAAWRDTQSGELEGQDGLSSETIGKREITGRPLSVGENPTRTAETCKCTQSYTVYFDEQTSQMRCKGCHYRISDQKAPTLG